MITPANTGVLGTLTGKTSDGKVFDSVEYENALKDSGYTDEEARAYWSPRRDPYSQESISDFVSSQVPKVSIQDNDITISAPKDVLDSPLVSQIKTELGSLKGMNLNNPEVKNAIDKLNEEIRTSFSSNIDQALGWTQEEYNEYQRAIQATSGSNPMSSKDLFAWGPDGKAIADEKGEIIMKTPSEWIEYWQGNYTPEERTELFKKSLQSNKPRERVMALFMAGPGSTRPIYGYTEGERLGQVFDAAASEMGKFPEGLVRLLGEDNNTKRLESLQKKTNIPVESLRKFNISNDEAFNSKINSIIGRAWSDLTDDEKAFVLEVGVSKGNPLLSEWEQKAFPRDKSVDALESALSSDNEISKEAIKTVLEGSSFDKYKEVRDNYDTWQGYDDWTKEDDVKMAENEIWSGISSQAGRVIGTIGRFLWEDAVVRGLTGGISLKSITNPSLATGAAAKEIASKGISMNRLSDKIAGSYETGAGIVGWLGKHNISPSSTVGKRLIEFGANLVGTIPEDILQTAVDNVVTYNPDENANLLDPTQMAESFRNNLIVMSLFNAARVGFNQIRLNRLANKIAKNADLSQPFDADGLASDADDLARAVREGQGISTDGGVVSVDDGDGGRKVLNNITSEQAKMAQLSLFDLDAEKFYSNRQDLDAALSRKNLQSATQYLLDAGLDEEEFSKRLNSLPQEVQDTVRQQIDRFGNPGQYDYASFRRALTSGTSDIIIDNSMLKNSSGQNIEVEPTAKVSVEVDTPDGRVLAEAPDYRPRNFDEAVKLKVEPTAPAVLHGQNVKLNTVMDSFQNEFLPDFRNRFGDVQTSDFDWVFHNSRNGLTPEEIIGTVNPETNRAVTKEMIDAMKWWADSPYTKDLRMASRDALGLDGDFNILGYLPHTTYDPTNMSFEEALTGRLWQQYTGASMTDEVGNYKGFGGDLQSRYRTFASNMLWDSMNNEVAAAKLMEEAQMDGVDLAPEQAVKAVEGEKGIRQKVNDAPSSKELTKALSSDSDDIDWNKIDDNIKKQAETSGLGKAIHDNYQDVYYGANGSAVGKQGNAAVNSFDTLGNRMRNTTIGNGMSMYDWGGADLVYAPKNAAELVTRYMNEGGDFRDMLIEYIENHSHRSPQYAESVADKWMAKLGEIPGELNKGKVIYSLSNSMKWEAMTRLKKWLTMANYDQFNDSTKKMIDRFLFNHMQMDSIKNNATIGQKLTKALDTLTGLRYRALFYGNIKNALLQTSELNRYFSSFKWGDVAQMAKRLATDESFRARVNTYVDAVAPSTSYLDAELYGKFSNVADSMDVEENGVRFRDLGKKTKETADAIGLGPIEAAESFKNHMMVAGLVQEADRLGLTGDEALRHIRRRFERVGLAADEMGRIGLSSNPLAKTMLFLQNFQIRELGMHLYNIMDEWKLGNSVPKKVLNATKYLTKVLGAKLATTLILARLGYSASQTMGLDPFGLLDNYTGMDEDDMEWVDKQIAGGMFTPFFSGGMTSLLADMYFMARKAYEDSSQQTVSDEAEQRLESSWGLAMPELTFDRAMEGAKNFVPGNVFLNRLNQMNEMMDTGWATSASGNKMYTAPQDALNTILGYLFGRSATQNAQQYNQSYGDNLLQTLGRFNPFREYGEFDPIDTKNYSDWFKGDDNDLQQFNKGRYWFQNERDRILGEYQKAIEDSYATSEDISEAQNAMNRKLDDLYDQLERFVAAYEKKNGTISPNMVKQVLNILNTGKNTVGETQEQRDARQLEDSSKALERYSQLGLSPVGTYTGPTKSSPDKETKYQGSPQYRAAVSGYYDIPDEVVRVLKLADNDLAPIREQIQSKLSHAYSIEDWDTVGSIQKDYLEQFDQVVAPIIASYGNSVLSSTDVSNQLKDMLSTGTNKRSGNLIPSDQYAQNKRGRYQSMPFESVDVGKWAQQRYSGDVYKQPTIRSYSTAEEDLEEIKKLSASGRPSRARARALELKVRVDNQERSLSKKDYQWLMDFLNKKGEQ